MLFEDDHYCLKCGTTVSGLDNYVNHRNHGCTAVKNNLPEHSENAPTEQLLSILQACTSAKKDLPEPTNAPTEQLLSLLEDCSASKKGCTEGSESAATAQFFSSNVDCVDGKLVPKASEDTPTEQFFSVLQLQRKSDAPIPQKASKIVMTRSKSRAMDGAEQKSVPKEKKKPKPKKLKLDGEKDVEDEDIWLDERRRIDCPPPCGGKSQPEIFSLSPMYLPEDKEVDKFLQDDYEDSYYQFMGLDDMQYDPPPRSDKGAGKSGSPNPWLTWESLIDAEETKKNGPPPSHTGGKWKPSESGGKFRSMGFLDAGSKTRSPDLLQDRNVFHPPESHTGGKWKSPSSGTSLVPPVSHTGGKWKPSAKTDHDLYHTPEAHDDSSTLTHERRISVVPPASHTGGKWKPSESGGKFKSLSLGIKSSSPDLLSGEGEFQPPEAHDDEDGKTPIVAEQENSMDWMSPVIDIEIESEVPQDEELYRGRHPRPGHTGGKWKPDDLLAPPVEHTRGKWLPAGPTKCLKTSGGSVEYYCEPCGRRLASKNAYKQHLMTNSHSRRLVQDADLEYDGRTSKLSTGSATSEAKRGRVRSVERPARYEDVDTGKPKKKRRGLMSCGGCKSKVMKGRLGKHLVSYYHYRRCSLAKPAVQELILANIHTIVRQSPYQCGPCRFYCNTPAQFKNHCKTHHSSSGESNTLSPKSYLWCSFCKFRCRRMAAMTEHLQSKEHKNVLTAINGSMPIIIRNPKVIQCSICKKDCMLNIHLRRHKLEAHQVAPPPKMQCTMCNFTGYSEKSLLIHYSKKHNQFSMPMECHVCQIEFSNAEEATIHRNSVRHRHNVTLASSNEEKKAALKRRCNECDQEFHTPYDLLNHNASVHPKKKYMCSRCGEEFGCSQHVSVHTRLHCQGPQPKEDLEKKYKYVCTDRDCSFGCDFDADFLLHKIHHVPFGNRDDFPCPVQGCDVLCKSKTHLRRHIVQHATDRKFSCPDCLLSYRMAHHLVQHRQSSCSAKQHQTEGEEKFQCECGYTTLSNSLFVRHRKTHEERTHKCPECPFVGTLPEHLKRHLVVHTGYKPFKCPYCDYTCNLMDNMRKHIIKQRKHKDKRVYECWHCQFVTNYLSRLMLHLNGEHADERESEQEVKRLLKERFANTQQEEERKPVKYNYKPPKVEKNDRSDEKPLPVIRPRILRPLKPKPTEDHIAYEEAREETTQMTVILNKSVIADPADHIPKVKTPKSFPQVKVTQISSNDSQFKVTRTKNRLLSPKHSNVENIMQLDGVSKPLLPIVVSSNGKLQKALTQKQCKIISQPSYNQVVVVVNDSEKLQAGVSEQFNQFLYHAEDGIVKVVKTPIQKQQIVFNSKKTDEVQNISKRFSIQKLVAVRDSQLVNEKQERVLVTDSINENVPLVDVSKQIDAIEYEVEQSDAPVYAEYEEVVDTEEVIHKILHDDDYFVESYV